MTNTHLAIKDVQLATLLKGLDPNLGTEEAAQAMNPNLTVVRNSERAPLADGKKAVPGQIYHAGLQKAWNTLDVHFVYAKRASLYSDFDEATNDWNRKGKKQNVLFVGGFLVESNQQVPFVYKVRGMNYSKFIDYQMTVDGLKKSFMVPMLVLTTHLTTQLEKNSRGADV